VTKAVDIEDLSRQLELICTSAEDMEARFASELAEVHPEFRDSARNLIDYMALRQIDIRDLQEQLTSLGLSSLGSAERHVMASIRTVRKALQKLFDGQEYELDTEIEDFEHSKRRLESHIDAILGPRSHDRNVRIMVTLPGESADDYGFICDLIESGMDIARINCAHDSQDVWHRMIENINRAKAETGCECRIVMDLAGPKIRTGTLMPGPKVLAIRPRRDPLGRVISAKRLRLVPEEVMSTTSAAAIPVTSEFANYAQTGDQIRFKDTRGRNRTLQVSAQDQNGLWVESFKTAYIATGTKLRLSRKQSGERLSCRVGELPEIEQPILLQVGDTLVLHTERIPGEPAVIDADGAVAKPAHISCSLPEVFEYISAGAPIRLNDGKIEGIVESVSGSELTIRITHAKASGSRLRGDRGINFPDSDIHLSGLTDTDKNNLDFVANHADAVGLSFIREAQDLIALRKELAKLSARNVGIIQKIETEQSFNDLPKLLLTAMHSYPVGVMIARGDLAVECGWERLAEIQEEILWLCEAAQIPVIWATQVLEGKAKKGQPTRAEITDAAMSQRADCVMLNKGPHILAAITMLDNILKRMQDHQNKKTPTLRKLSVVSA